MRPKRKATLGPSPSPESAPTKRRTKAVARPPPSHAIKGPARTKFTAKSPAASKRASISSAETPATSTGLAKNKAKTMKDRVLYVLANATVLMGLPTLKKHLMEEFALQESKVFNTNVKKALAELSASPRDDFGKIGGSYHAGMSSVAYKAKEKADAELEDAQKYIDQGCIKCCFCGEWCPGDCELGEDSIARGSKYRCVSCNKIFWSWISDGYTVAHEVEYKKSFNY